MKTKTKTKTKQKKIQKEQKDHQIKFRCPQTVPSFLRYHTHLDRWQIQWGSEQQTSSVFKWSKTVHLSNGFLFKPCLEQCTNILLIKWYSNGILLPNFLPWSLIKWSPPFNQQPSEYQTSKSLLFKQSPLDYFDFILCPFHTMGYKYQPKDTLKRYTL